MSKILFIAHNTHQERYFKTLQENLPFDIIVKRAKFSFCNAPKIDLSKKFEELNNKWTMDNGQWGPQKIKKFFGEEMKIDLYKQYLKQEAKLIYCYYKSVIEKYRPDILGIWNGVKYPQFMINEFDVKKIYFENGFLPNTTQADCKGVNALNSIPREKEFYEKLNYYQKPLPKELIPRPPVKKLQGDEIDLKREYVFIPLQVNYDSQIIYFSPYIKSMQEFFELINDIADEFDFDFIFKAHPSDRVTDYESLIKKAKKNVLFATNQTQDLIKNAKAVITINSSVGIESLLFNKRVITLGEAFYNIDGIVKHIKPNELKDTLKNLDWEVDERLIKNFLGYLYYEYLIPSSWKHPDKSHFEKLTSRISQCLQ
ncbi:MAG: capsular biosynthesis protein [Epsilonproteobacteria bacterium]|nr:capsular biosynthesis protein [Campylobacterota bacterium]